jgi:hypothetical protein
MRTRLVIVAIVLVAVAVAVGVVVTLMGLLGPWPGLAAGALGAAVVLAAYRRRVQPWQHRWGATDDEVAAAMPGDEVIPDAASTTRAVTIAARPEQVWPWLVQLGYGRAGWYSYDWIDNDGQRSADRVVPELQDLAVGDQVPMIPGVGPRLRAIEPGRHLLAGDTEGGTWCLALHPAPEGTRLVSRWRVRWTMTPATAFWILLSDPGAFIMERRMLEGLKARVEHAAALSSV